jgi:hypothetical protein
VISPGSTTTPDRSSTRTAPGGGASTGVVLSATAASTDSTAMIFRAPTWARMKRATESAAARMGVMRKIEKP